MTLTIQDERLSTLAKELADLIDKPIPQPTQQEYHALMKVKGALKKLPEEVELSLDDRFTQRGLVVMAYRVFEGMENFFEHDGNQWAA